MGSGSATIRVEREAGGYTDRLRAYTVLVDGAEVGKVKRGESVETPVAAGAHLVQMKVDWTRSIPVKVEVADGEQARLSCAPNANPLTILWNITFGRHRYIDLVVAAD